MCWKRNISDSLQAFRVTEVSKVLITLVSTPVKGMRKLRVDEVVHSGLFKTLSLLAVHLILGKPFWIMYLSELRSSPRNLHVPCISILTMSGLPSPLVAWDVPRPRVDSGPLTLWGWCISKERYYMYLISLLVHMGMVVAYYTVVCILQR